MNGVPWNYDEVYDCWEMVHRHSGFVSQIKKLQAMTMCHPFKLIVDEVPVILKPEMDFLIRTEWMKMCPMLFLYKFCFGIVPYYEKPIKGTAHRVPRIPSIKK